MKFEQPSIPEIPERKEQQEEIKEIVDSLMSGGNQEGLKEIAEMPSSAERNRSIAAIFQAVIDQLEKNFGLERYSQEEDPDHPGAVKSREKLDEFMQKYPHDSIREAIEEKLKSF